MSAVFITATGTDVGKTFVARGLIRLLRGRGHKVEALKPIVSGFEPAEAEGSDAGLLLKALGRPITMEAIAEVSPWRFALPVAPDMAAAREGRALDYRGTLDFCKAAIAANHEALLIEGAGGLMSPIDNTHTNLDWMRALDIPIVVVAGSYLGTISHTLTALDVLLRHGLTIAALVVSESVGSPVKLDETCQAIARFLPQVEIVALPRLPGKPEHPAFEQLAAKL